MSDADLPGLPEDRIDAITNRNAGRAAQYASPRHLHRRRRWLGSATLWLALAILTIAGIAIYALLAGQHTNSQNGALQGQVKALQDQVKQLGGTPVTATGAQGPKGDKGDTGPQPTAAQIQSAVALYCQTSTCGTPPTTAQVASAVARYCNANGECRGQSGPSGSAGATGSPGPAGPRGPGPTDEQVAAAVATYCQANGCVGPSGPTGPAGPAGAPGQDATPPDTFTFQVGAVTLQCTRNNTSTTAPTYTCNRVGLPADTTTSGG